MRSPTAAVGPLGYDADALTTATSGSVEPGRVGRTPVSPPSSPAPGLTGPSHASFTVSEHCTDHVATLANTALAQNEETLGGPLRVTPILPPAGSRPLLLASSPGGPPLWALAVRPAPHGLSKGDQGREGSPWREGV